MEGTVKIEFIKCIAKAYVQHEAKGIIFSGVQFLLQTIHHPLLALNNAKGKAQCKAYNNGLLLHCITLKSEQVRYWRTQLFLHLLNPACGHKATPKIRVALQAYKPFTKPETVAI